MPADHPLYPSHNVDSHCIILMLSRWHYFHLMAHVTQYILQSQDPYCIWLFLFGYNTTSCAVTLDEEQLIPRSLFCQSRYVHIYENICQRNHQPIPWFCWTIADRFLCVGKNIQQADLHNVTWQKVIFLSVWILPVNICISNGDHCSSVFCVFEFSVTQFEKYWLVSFSSSSSSWSICFHPLLSSRSITS